MGSNLQEYFVEVSFPRIHQDNTEFRPAAFRRQYYTRKHLFKDLPYDPHKIQTGEFFNECVRIIELLKTFKQVRNSLCTFKSARGAFYAVEVGTYADMVFSGNGADMFDMSYNIVNIRPVGVI